MLSAVLFILLVVYAIGNSASTSSNIKSSIANFTNTSASSMLTSTDDDRLRILDSYVQYLKIDPLNVQSNGLSGNTVSGVCDLWAQLQPSARDVFITITSRMGGSTLSTDGSSVLSHVKTLYRLVGGEGATSTSSGTSPRLLYCIMTLYVVQF